jgi:hypothetical protein
MYNYVLWVTLIAGEPAIPIPVHDCTVQRAWTISAREWAERSGVTATDGPLSVCGPANWRPANLVRVRGG